MNRIILFSPCLYQPLSIQFKYVKIEQSKSSTGRCSDTDENIENIRKCVTLSVIHKCVHSHRQKLAASNCTQNIFAVGE
jgi:hypothetical protein